MDMVETTMQVQWTEDGGQNPHVEQQVNLGSDKNQSKSWEEPISNIL